MNPAHTVMSARRLKVTGSLSSSGSMTIPAGTFQIDITAAGGYGGDDSWYDPGQPYIAPSDNRTWSLGYALISSGTSVNDPGWGSPAYPTPCDGCGGFIGESWWNGVDYSWSSYEWWSVQSGGSIDPGQPYIAPSSGGGPYYGPTTTASLNGVGRSWLGGYGSGVPGTVSTQTLQSPDAIARSLSYSVAGGGSFNYVYFK